MSGTDYTTTPNLGLIKPAILADDGRWGSHWNANADVLDGTLSTTVGGAFLPLAITTSITVTLSMGGSLRLTGLPTTKPAAGSGIVWNNGGVLCVA